MVWRKRSDRWALWRAGGPGKSKLGACARAALRREGAGGPAGEASCEIRRREGGQCSATLEGHRTTEFGLPV